MTLIASFFCRAYIRLDICYVFISALELFKLYVKIFSCLLFKPVLHLIKMLVSITSPAVKLNFLYRFFRFFCQELAHYDAERVSIPKGYSALKSITSKRSVRANAVPVCKFCR